MIWHTNTYGIMVMDLLYRLTLWSNMCEDFGSNGFVIKTWPFPMDGHYRTNIISGVGHPRSDSVVSLVLYTVAVEWLGHRHCTTDSSGQRQPY
jgi:hypothetical protein